MKTSTLLTILFIALMSLACFIPEASAQVKTSNVDVSKTDNNLRISLSNQSIAVDSGDYYYSNDFKIEKFDGVSFTTYPVRWWMSQSSVTAKPHITWILQGTNDDGSTYGNVDTLGAVGDSIETAQIGTIDFNGFRYNAYRFKFSTTNANALDAIISNCGILFVTPEN